MASLISPAVASATPTLPTAPSSASSETPPGAVSTCPELPETTNQPGMRCINGSWIRSRGFNTCLSDAYKKLLSFNVYLSNECYGASSSNDYFESIAEARLVRWLNFASDPSGTGVVHGRIQWEMRLPSKVLEKMSGLSADGLRNLLATDAGAIGEDGAPLKTFTVGYRPDVALIGADTSAPASNDVQVIELKGSWNGGEAAAEVQTLTYVMAMKAAGWSGARAADLTGYADNFRVVYKCESAKSSHPVYDEYQVKGGAGGVAVVSKIDDGECRDGEKRTKYANKTEVKEEIPGVESVPVTEPTVAGRPVSEMAPPASSSDTSVDASDPVNWPLVVGTGAGATAGSAAVVRYLLSRYLVPALNLAARGTRAAVFEDVKNDICLKNVNIFTQKPGSGSVTPEALTCLEVANAAALVAFLAALHMDLTPEELQKLGMTEEESVAAGLGQSPAAVRADPRLVTLDGLNYDFHGVGEYTLLEHAISGLNIQMRTVPATNDMSSVGSLAVQTGDQVFEFGPDGSALLDGVALDLPEGALLYLGDGTLLSKHAGEIQLLTAFDDYADQALIGWTPRAGGRGDFRLRIPKAWAGQTTGMLGDFDGNPRDDLVSANGVDVTPSLNFGVSDTLYLQRLYGVFGDSWRVTEDSSLFTYPAGKGPANYVDRSYPRSVTTLGSLSEAAYASALAVCTQAGVAPGLGLDDCILDVATSGDTSYATSLAGADTFGVSLDDVSIGEDPLEVRFSGDVPPNFFPGRIRSTAQGLNFAGTFAGGDHYSWYLNDMPGHRTIDLRARIVTATPMATDAQVELVLGSQVVKGTIDPASTSEVTLGDGSTASVVDVAFSSPHSARDVVGQLRLKGGSDVAWFGVASLSIDLERVPFQLFDIQLESGREYHTATNSQASGTGVLEGAGSSDRYCFTLAAGSAVVLDASRIGYPVAWTVRSLDGSFASRSGRRGEAVRLAGISGPACVDVYADGSATPSYWAYDLALVLVPAAQSFGLDLADVRKVSARGLG
ncbi:VWD domain-containing protein, partial [Cellulomonas soli]